MTISLLMDYLQYLVHNCKLPWITNDQKKYIKKSNVNIYKHYIKVRQKDTLLNLFDQIIK